MRIITNVKKITLVSCLVAILLLLTCDSEDRPRLGFEENPVDYGHEREEDRGS